MLFIKILGGKSFGIAALLAALSVSAISVAAENSAVVAHPYVQTESGCRRSNGVYHYRYHYRAYRPRIHVMPRKYYPRKKKKPLIF
ncbi:MAG TPA: hypothetical protein VKB71_03015 [Rhizomicrobium sp.]|nr:hypothetical protein [Rhizomicrobium sp.]